MCVFAVEMSGKKKYKTLVTVANSREAEKSGFNLKTQNKSFQIKMKYDYH